MAHHHHFNSPPSMEVDHDPTMEILMNPFPDFNPGALMGFSSQEMNCFSHLHDQLFPGILADNFPLVFPEEFKNVLPISDPNADDDKKRKSMQLQSTPESSSANSSPPASENRSCRRKNSSSRGKRARSDEKEEGKSKEVVHVRAKRGQATDSHSLAERVRRGKINERLRCLQDIVPGCQKTMGMAVMLDEIINYVQSLQNQVEFLSMKLTAASNSYNFNGETDTIDAIQRAKAFEAMKMHKRMKEEWDGLAASASSTQLGHFDLTFGCYPSLPYNT